MSNFIEIICKRIHVIFDIEVTLVVKAVIRSSQKIVIFAAGALKALNSSKNDIFLARQLHCHAC